MNQSEKILEESILYLFNKNKCAFSLDDLVDLTKPIIPSLFPNQSNLVTVARVVISLVNRNLLFGRYRIYDKISKTYKEYKTTDACSFIGGQNFEVLFYKTNKFDE